MKMATIDMFIASRKSDANILSDDELKLYKDGMNKQEIANRQLLKHLLVLSYHLNMVVKIIVVYYLM